jgi:hypothetical protein
MIELLSDREFRYLQKVHLKVAVEYYREMKAYRSFCKKLRKTAREKAQKTFIELSKCSEN